MTFIEIEHKARELKAKIQNAKPVLDIKGTTYYVSLDGDDNNDGLSPKTAWKTLFNVNQHSKEFKPGDAVLFRCGDIFRPAKVAGRHLYLQPGVTYSSFGEGAKPEFRANTADAIEFDWVDEGNNIYSLQFDHGFDVGSIVFDGGKEWGFKLVNGVDADTSPRLDLDYFHDPFQQKLYLCSEYGHPTKRWKSIEIAPRCSYFGGTDDNRPEGAVIDGLAFRHIGGFGISLSTVDYPESGEIYYKGFSDFTVRNCEFEWIGGSLMRDPKTSTVRYGNGFEIWGGGSNLLVENCYFNQIYDAAITQQFHVPNLSGDKPVTVEDSVFRNNLFENNTYDYEYFLTERKNPDTNFAFKNIRFENNICRKSGYGFGAQRPDRNEAASIKSWAHQNKSEDFVIRNNIFDRGDYVLVEAISALDPKYRPILDGNVYCQYECKGWISAIKGQPASRFTRDNIKNPTEHFAEENAICVKPLR